MEDSFLEQHPMVKQALGDQVEAFRLRGVPEVPPALTHLQQRSIEVLERTVTGPAAEKEALLAAVVISTAPPEMFNEPESFVQRYTPEVQAIVDDLMVAQPGTVMPTALARVTMSLNIAMMEDALARVRGGTLKPPPEVTVEQKRQSDAQEPLLCNIDCPPLRQAYDQVKKTLYWELGLRGPRAYKIMHPITWPPKPRS
jgi:hypothetical protein